MSLLRNMRLISLKTNPQILPILSHKLLASKNFYYLNKCKIHTSSVKLLFFESDPKGEYKKFRTKLSTKELIRNGLKQIKEEIQLWKTEVRETWDSDFVLRGTPGVIDKEFQFRNEKDLSKWIVTSDKDNMEGQSTCELTLKGNGKAVFTGNLCLDVPKDGNIHRTGYCNIRTVRHKTSFQRDSHHDWGMYTHLVMRVRGDGRTYAINLSSSSYFDITWNDIYSFALYTRGGPYWQYAKIPFSRFFFTSKGRVQDIQYPVPLFKISSVGITMAERAAGPFYLEIDYIGLENDPTHTEKFAYEMYRIPSGIAQN